MKNPELKKKIRQFVEGAKQVLDWIIVSIFLSIPIILIYGAINAISGRDVSRRIGRIRIQGLGTDFGLVAGLALGFALLGGVLVLIRYSATIWAWIKVRPAVKWGLAALIVVVASVGVFLSIAKTPTEQLAIAVNEGDPAELEAVLSRNEIEQRYLNSQLSRTVREGRFELSEVLLASGADIDHLERADDYTMLQTAILLDDKETILFLIDSGADLEVTNNLGDTPLMTLIEFRLSKENMSREEGAEIVEAMLAAGADPAHINDFGQTARDYAEERNYTQILAVLP